MRNIAYILSIAILLAGCDKSELDNGGFNNRHSDKDNILTASIETDDNGDKTRTSLGEWDEANGKYYQTWSVGDEITLFSAGETGTCELISGEGTASATFACGISGSDYVAIYPSSIAPSLSNGTVSLTLPSVQTYMPDSFGENSFPMIAVSSDKSLNFMNLCAVLRVSIVGDYTVKSIKVTANTSTDYMSGAATVSTAYTTAPLLTMSDGGSASVTLDCGDGVELSPTENKYFNIVIPAQQYAGGITIDVETETETITNNISTTFTAVRSMITPVKQFEVAQPTGNIVFADGTVRILCVKYFDTDDDGELSYQEARDVTDIGNVFQANKTIASFDELKYFTSLTALGQEAFTDCTNLQSIILPDGITEIGYKSFDGCTKLQSIILSKNLTEIGNFAFLSCASLPDIVLPKSVTTIGRGAFKGCSSLTSITIPDSVTEINEQLFSNCTKLKSVILPKGITNIYKWAFNKCSSLTQIVLPETVTEIGTYAFWHCESLTQLVLPESVTMIREGAFNSCTSLKSFTIPDSVTFIDDSTFEGCTGLESVKMGTELLTIYARAFYGCNALQSIEIPSQVTTIDKSAFAKCTGVQSVTFGDKSKCDYIGDNAFEECVNLQSVTLPNKLTYFSGFNGCTGLKSITIPANVLIIGNQALKGCTGLTSINIPQYCNAIGASAFYGCSGITSTVELPKSLSEIGGLAFKGCSGELMVNCNIQNAITTSGGLGSGFSNADAPQSRTSFGRIEGAKFTKVTIAEGVTSIGSYAFFDCADLVSITIPNTVTSIGSNAFFVCTNLVSITIPNSVTSIDFGAFSGCGLTSVTIPNSVKSISTYLFQKCTELTSVTIPNTVTSIGASAFIGCTKLSSITIPNSVTTIGQEAFRNCSNLASVYVKADVSPTGGTGIFSGTASGMKIYVPVNSVDAYKGDSFWSSYKDSIFGYNF